MISIQHITPGPSAVSWPGYAVCASFVGRCNIGLRWWLVAGRYSVNRVSGLEARVLTLGSPSTYPGKPEYLPWEARCHSTQHVSVYIVV